MRRILLMTIVGLILSDVSQAQDQLQNLIGQGQVHGNFQAEAQYYTEDTLIGTPIVPEVLRMNAFANVNYTNGPISAGLRFESYQNALQGYPVGYQGNGIPYRYFTYSGKNLSFTAGNFYEQFGNGFIFRTYEERGLGYDNVMDGIRIQYELSPGIRLKGIIGQQRIFFDKGPGIVRGADIELGLNEIFQSLKESNHRISLGGSFVSKYQADERSDLELPENVGSYAARLKYRYKKISFSGEYVNKINDPSFDNGYIYNDGEVIYLQSSFSTKGLGITASVERVDNMSFKSDREIDGNNLLINYVPALTRQHTYNLLASLYPYATQLNGQVGAQLEITKKFKKSSPLGGKYGTTIGINVSAYNNLDTITYIDEQRDSLGLRPGYRSTYNLNGEKFWREFNFELTKKFSKKISWIFNYSYIEYNQNVIEVKANPWDLVYANIFVSDLTYRLNTVHALRLELQELYTHEDAGSWAMALLEYTYAPHWYFAVMDQYNYGNPVDYKQLHYYSISTGYNKDGTRISLSYGRQRAGIFCVGGVCRVVPASNGLYMSITHSF